MRAELLDEKSLAEFMRPLRQANAPPPQGPVGAPHAQPTTNGRHPRFSGLFDSVGRDLRHALRGLRRRPAFTLVTVLTLALGVAATTAIFSVVYSVLIKPLSYPNADELVRIRHTATSGVNLGELSSSTAPSMYVTYRRENRTFAEIGLWWELGVTITGFGDPERVRALVVTDGTLQALGVQPMLGRGFTEAEHGPAAEGPTPVLLSYAFWQRRFGGDEAALGRQFSLENGPGQVVGVMPRDFRFLASTPQPDIIAAVGSTLPQLILAQFNYHALARLKPGVTPAEASADLERMLPIWLDEWPAGPPNASITREAVASWNLAPVVRPLKEDVVGSIVASTLWVLMAAIGAVLLIACANIANLMLCERMRGGRSSPCAWRSAPASCASRESCSSKACCSARGEERSAWCSRMPASSSCSRSARAICRAFRRLPSIRPCLRSAWRFRSRRRCCSAPSRRSSMPGTSTHRCSAGRAGRVLGASAQRSAAHSSSCRWRSRSCSSSARC